MKQWLVLDPQFEAIWWAMSNWPLKIFLGYSCFTIYKELSALPWPGGSVGWSIIPYTKKGYRFAPWSGHIPRLWVWSPVGAHMRGNRLIFLSHIDVSLCLSLPLSLKSINISSGDDLKKRLSAFLSLFAQSKTLKKLLLWLSRMPKNQDKWNKNPTFSMALVVCVPMFFPRILKIKIHIR